MYTPTPASINTSISENLWAMDNLKSELEVHQLGHSSIVSQIAVIIFMNHETVTATAIVTKRRKSFFLRTTAQTFNSTK